MFFTESIAVLQSVAYQIGIFAVKNDELKFARSRTANVNSSQTIAKDNMAKFVLQPGTSTEIIYYLYLVALA